MSKPRSCRCLLRADEPTIWVVVLRVVLRSVLVVLRGLLGVGCGEDLAAVEIWVRREGRSGCGRGSKKEEARRRRRRKKNEGEGEGERRRTKKKKKKEEDEKKLI